MKIRVLEVLAYFRNHFMKSKFLFVVLLLTSFGTGFIGLVSPFFYKSIIDTASSNYPKDIILSKLLSTFSYMVLFGVITWIVWRLMEFTLVKFELRIMGNIYRECFNYIHKHSYKFFSNNFGGSLVKKINRLVDSVEGFVDTMIFEVIKLIISSVSVIAIVGYQNTYLGIIFTCWIFIFAIISFMLSKWHYKYWQKAVEYDSVVSGSLADSITNNYNISIFGSLKSEFTRFSGIITDRQKAIGNSWYGANINYAILSVFSIFMELLMLYYSIKLWYNGLIGIGTFVLIISYQIILAGQLFSIGRIFRRMNTIFGNASEMLEILKTPHDILDISGAKELEVSKGEIDFKNVKFAYNNSITIFDGLNLKISPAEKIALVGHSGSGKSSIVKLLFRFYDIESGVISIDGQDISKVRQESLRSSIAMVPQDPLLFHRSLYENIIYANPDASQEEVIKVSKMSHCHEFISRLPQGYNTLVGERGIKLSGGERQRIAIARALLSKAKILVLDEATSSLDSQSESLIQDAIDHLMDNKTLIVIAHRLSTIMKMDRIVVMDNGTIIEEGTHKSLVSKEGGIYKSLWDIQSGGFIQE